MEVKANKIHVILYNSYEFDDLGYGDLTPYFLSLSEEECKEEFEKIRNEEINNFQRMYKNKEEWLKDHPDFEEDYKININSDTEIEIYFGNWCYHYVLTSYELNKRIK